ncbi:hypothetical protein GCM10023165_34240 [Variovorax defluvii]|uniref:N-acetyltransferase domain-containing protein n=1 Tax=Variovorax defluvii TaxID=913761 RepID=A0ABP8HZV7_9BURK
MSTLKTVVDNARSSAHFARILMSVTEETPAEALTAWLDGALGSFGHFRDVWPYVILALRRNHRVDRRRIAQRLSRMWCDSSVHWDPETLRGLARVAYLCFDLCLARRALQALSGLQAPSVTDLLLEANCHAACGDLRQALNICGAVLDRSPHNTQAIALHRSWTQRVARASDPWQAPIIGSDGLRLEPMHVEHAAALAWQYRDPAIAARTLLPPLEEWDAAEAWIEHRRSYSNVVPYVLLHREHGLLGSTEITVSGTEAFLCIWIGADWQGRGYGRRMTAMACEHAFRCGIEVMLTAAFDDNVASLRTLRGYGFGDVAIRAAHPDHDRIFLSLPTRPMGPDEIVRRLIGFSDRADTGFVFPVPGQTGKAPDLPMQTASNEEDR